MHFVRSTSSLNKREELKLFKSSNQFDSAINCIKIVENEKASISRSNWVRKNQKYYLYKEDDLVHDVKAIILVTEVVALGFYLIEPN